MKKLIFSLCLAFAVLMPVSIYAEETDTSQHIYISTTDCSKAIDIYSNSSFNDSRMGNPFHLENTDEIFFPIINNYKIVWINQIGIDENGNIISGQSESTDNMKFDELKDGNIYTIIADDEYNIFAVSDNKTVILRRGWDRDEVPDDKLEIPQPDPDSNRTVVDILSPLFNETSIIFLPSDYGAVTENGRTLMPLNKIAEILNAETEWNNIEKSAVLFYNNNTLKFISDSNVYTINDEYHQLDVPAKIINDRLYIPLRAAGEAFGFSVEYNSSTKEITLS